MSALSVGLRKELMPGFCILFLVAISCTASAEQRLLLKGASMVITMDTSAGEAITSVKFFSVSTCPFVQ